MAYGLRVENFESQGAKLVLGALTLLPVVYTPYFIAVYFFWSDSPQKPYSDSFTNFLFVGQCAISLLCFALLFVYATHTFRSPFVSGKARLFWLLAFLFLGPLGMLAYWLINVWPTRGTAL